MSRVAVLGAGCIGQWVGGHLASAGIEVVLVGRSVLQRTVAAGRLHLTDVERDANGFELSLELPSVVLKTSFDVEQALRSNDFDAVFVCLKIHDNQAAACLANLKHDTVIVSLQNGVDNQRILGSLLPRHTVVAGMVPYGVVEVAPGSFRRGTYGPLAFTDTMPLALTSALRKSGLAVDLHNNEDMHAVQWCKLLINLGNALNALVGQPLDSCMQHRRYRQLLAATWEEGLHVMAAKGINIQGDINGQPLAKAAKLIRLPSVLLNVAKRVKRVQAIDPSYHSSMFYDLEARRETEVGELNGRVVKMANEAQVQAPVNELLTRLTREAQRVCSGSPRLSIEDLFAQAVKMAPGTLASRQCFS